jgi:hypothetical protein
MYFYKDNFSYILGNSNSSKNDNCKNDNSKK